MVLIYKIASEIWGPSVEKSAAQKHENFDQISDSNIDREYLLKEPIYRGKENNIANYNLSCARLLNLVNFGLQTAKTMPPRTGVSIDLMRSRCVGHVS